MTAIINAFAFPLFLIISTHLHATSKTIIIYRLDSGYRSDTIAWVQQMAIDEINTNPNILQNYTLKMKVLKSASPTDALRNAAMIQELFSGCSSQYNSSMISPIILGPPWSSMSLLTSIVFNINLLLQISESATLSTLSSATYTSFFRTIPDNTLQAQALVKLCEHFGWTRIGVVYMHDDYGDNINKLIEETAAKKDIKVYSRFVSQTNAYDNDTFRLHVEFIRDLSIYVTILMIDGNLMPTFLDIANAHGILGYPYFFIGMDAWFNNWNIHDHEWGFSNLTIGYIGTTVTIPAMVPPENYAGNMTIYNISKTIVKTFTQELENTGKMWSNSPIMAFAYDAVWAAVYALDTYDKKHSLDDLNHIELTDITSELYYILNDIKFIGMSGLVQFKDGDRKNGIIGYGNVNDDGYIANIGYFSINQTVINTASISWPKDFMTPPRTYTVVRTTISGISGYLIAIVAIAYCFCCCLILCLLRLIGKNRYVQEKIVYLSLSIGLLLCCCWMVLYGLQTNAMNVLWHDIWCVISPIMLCISFTFTFLAFIASKSELLRIVIKFMKRNKFSGYHGSHGVSNKLRKCLCMDVMVVLVFILIYVVVYFTTYLKLSESGLKELRVVQSSTDALVDIQELYPVCIMHLRTNICWFILFVYKMIQMIYSMDTNVGFVVSCVILIVCTFCVGIIAGSWYVLRLMLLDDVISIDTNFLLLSFVMILMYLLWIVWEYYHLHNKRETAGQDVSSIKSTFRSKVSTNTQANTVSSTKYDHMTCEEVDELCEVELTQINQ
eukprot:177489_1